MAVPLSNVELKKVVSSSPSSKARISTEILTLIFEKDSRAKPKIVVSKKVAILAVDRNRIRRIIKEALRNLNLKQTLTIIVKRNIADKKTQEVQEILQAITK